MDRIIKDKMPQGITRLSTEFIERKIGQLCLPQPFGIAVHREKPDEEICGLVTQILFQDPADPAGRIILETDGFEVGYGGEGPCGLLHLLQKTGMKIPEGEDPRRIKVEFGGCQIWKSKTQPWLFGKD
jgi:hypothetical protein